MIKCVLFDCDGVLMNSEQLYEKALGEKMAEYGLIYTTSNARRTLGMTSTKKINAMRDVYPALPALFGNEVYTRYLSIEQNKLQVTQGLRKNLQLLRGWSIPYAIGSNSRTENLHRKLKLTDLFNQFAPHIYNAELVRVDKPKPDLYHFAAAQLDCQLAEALVIEDSEIGAEAGVAGGAEVLGFVGLSEYPDLSRQMLEQVGVRQIFDSMSGAAGIEGAFRKIFGADKTHGQSGLLPNLSLP